MPARIDSTATNIPHRLHPLHCAAALVFASLLGHNAIAAEVSRIGSDGVAGSSGPAPTPGRAGGTASATVLGSDLLNTATATAGAGGSGGSNTAGGLGADGGQGGAAAAGLRVADQLPPPFEYVTLFNSVTANGGNGGNAGTGLLPGTGGRGGAANALGLAPGSTVIDTETAGQTENTLLVNANGGSGGSGLVGGAGGDARGSGYLAPVFSSIGSTATTTALGGAGGGGLLIGGAGGNASAAAQTNTGGHPSFDRAEAFAVGGKGGDSRSRFHGNGGNAAASATGTYAARDLGVDIIARATGGDSGNATGLALSGRGGNAQAVAQGRSNAPGSVAPQAVAIGGAGAVRGGDAVARADTSARYMGAYATAHATGGAGPQAGAALATTTSASPWLFNQAQASADYSGPLLRRAEANGSTFTFENGSVASRIVAQASAGDVTHLSSPLPPADNATLVARTAAAPAASVANAVLAANDTIAGTLNGGAVWAIGEFGTGTSYYDELNAGFSYTFDTADATSDRLWLGLLDSALPADSGGSFRFAVAGEGTTLFERDFIGSELHDFFDDRAFDLSSLFALVGSDGLLDINVSFSGYVDNIGFLIGQANADPFSQVPEPALPVLLLTGLTGIWLMRRRKDSLLT